MRWRKMFLLIFGVFGLALPVGAAAGQGQHGWMGMALVEETINTPAGPRTIVVVGQVVPNSPAAQAGVMEGDVIGAIQGRQVRSAHDVQEFVKAHRPGSRITLQILRAGQAQMVSATLRAQPVASAAPAGQAPVPASGPTGSALQAFPPIDIGAINAARAGLTLEARNAVAGGFGVLAVRYAPGWLAQPVPNGLRVQHRDGVTAFEAVVSEAALHASPDVLLNNLFLPVIHRSAQDVRVLAAFPFPAPPGVGKEYYLTGIYQGKRVFGDLVLVTAPLFSSTLVTALWATGLREQFPVLYAMAVEARLTPVAAAGPAPPVGGSSGSNLGLDPGLEFIRERSGYNRGHYTATQGWVDTAGGKARMQDSRGRDWLQPYHGGTWDGSGYRDPSSLGTYMKVYP